MRKLNVGIIGTGFIGPAHIEALRRTGLAEVIALADINAEVAKAKAEVLSVPQSFGDYKDLLAQPDIDIVHICTPNYLHFIMSRDAMIAGKHVVCEKPLAMSFEEAEELTRIAKTKELVNAMHFNVRFYPAIHQVKAMIDKGDLGEILAVNGSYMQDWLLFDTDYNWRLEPEYSGESRAIGDIGSHWLDSVEFMTSLKVKKVCADIATFYPIRKKPKGPQITYSSKLSKTEEYIDIPIKTEDYAAVLIRFEGKAHGSLTVNQMAAGRKNRCLFEIFGSKRSVVIDTEHCNEVWIGNRNYNNEILLKDPALLEPTARAIVSFPGGHNEGYPDTSKQLFKKVYSYILNGLNGTVEFPTFKDGERELLICERILESARTCSWVNL